jgi:phosphate transport system protein
VPREGFDRELRRLSGEVVGLGREVENSLEAMAKALAGWDATIAEERLGSDARFKEQGARIAEGCMILQARQAPLARDLRLLNALRAITTHLARAGTLGEHVCRAVVDTAGRERNAELEAVLLRMARGARELFGRGLDVFENRDMRRVGDLEALDDEVDLLYLEAMNLMVAPGAGSAGSPEWRVRAALVAHYLERIADHGVEIGERTVFLVTGQRAAGALRRHYRGHRPERDED